MTTHHVIVETCHCFRDNACGSLIYKQTEKCHLDLEIQLIECMCMCMCIPDSTKKAVEKRRRAKEKHQVLRVEVEAIVRGLKHSSRWNGWINLIGMREN